jgi:hypothetical protein
MLTAMGATLALIKAWWTSNVSRILVSLLIVYFVLWYFVPLCLNVFLWDELFVHTVSENDYLLVAALEIGAFAAIIFSFLGCKAPIRIIQRSSLNSIRITPAVLICVALATTLLTTYFYISEDYGVGYLGKNAFQTTEGGSSAFNQLGTLSILLGAGLSLMCAAIVKSAVPNLPKWIIAILVAVILFYNYTQIVAGSRIELLYPVYLFMLYTLANKWSQARIFKTLLIVAPIITFAICFITLALENTRVTSSNAVEGVGEASSAIDVSDLQNLMAQSLVTKLDEFSPGAILLEKYGPGDGGIKTYAGSVLAWLPRFLYKDKPVPGSCDGTYYGTPARMVAAYNGANIDIGSTGIGVASMAIWQLGYANLFLLILSNVINLRVLNTLFMSSSTVAWAAAFWLIGLPAMMGLIATPDAILMSLQRFALVIVLFELVSRVLPEKKCEVRAVSLTTTHW